MARRAPTEDRQSRAASEADSHGGLVALTGPEPGWYWRDEWDRWMAGSARFAGYVETSELAENRNITDPSGVNLRWYGKAVVFRFDPSRVPPNVPTPDAEPIPPRYCVCGERLLLPRIGRVSCERCRLGVTTPVIVWRPHGVAHSGSDGVPVEVPTDLDDPGDPAGLEPAPESVIQPQPPCPPPLSPDEVADFVWSHVAALYDR